MGRTIRTTRAFGRGRLRSRVVVSGGRRGEEGDHVGGEGRLGVGEVEGGGRGGHRGGVWSGSSQPWVAHEVPRRGGRCGARDVERRRSLAGYGRSILCRC